MVQLEKISPPEEEIGRDEIAGANRWIPEGVIDAILSRLPVKSLIRFQTLSKSHRSIIFDPWFSKINYINQSTKSSNLFLRLNHEDDYYSIEPAPIEFALVRFNGEDFETLMELGNALGAAIPLKQCFNGEDFETLMELGNPFGAAIPLCCCNGIVLLAWKWPGGGLVLWNPSIRRHAAILTRGPDSLLWLDHLNSWLHFGLYYDSRVDDYKVVVISMECNMIFSCKTTTWTREESFPLLGGLNCGVFLDGCFYYLQSESRVACFDFRENEFRKLEMPDMNPNPTDVEVRLTTRKGHLCAYCLSRDGTEFRAWEMQERDYSWTELKNLENTGPHLFLPGRFLLHRAFNTANSEFIIYNHPEKRFEKSERFSDVEAMHLVPYIESLFFPS